MAESVRALAGRVGAYARLAREGPDHVARTARSGNERRWRLEAIELLKAGGIESPTEAEIVRRASYIRQREMSRLALLSAQARRRRKAAAP